MSSKGDTFENDLLKLISNAVSIADICTTTGTANLTIALHTATPGEGGTQLTNEAAYTGYVRVSVARTAGGWLVTANSVSPIAAITFGECTASPGSPITHFSIGTGIGNKMLYYGPVTPNITMAVGVIPQLKITSTITED